MGAFITNPPAPLSFASSTLLLSRLFHCRSLLALTISLSRCAAAALPNEQPAPGHITPTDKMPPLSLPSLPLSLCCFPGPSQVPSLAHLPCFRIGVSHLASSRQPHKKGACSTVWPVWLITFRTFPNPFPFFISTSGCKMITHGHGPLSLAAASVPLSPSNYRNFPLHYPPSPSQVNRLGLRFTHEIKRHVRVGNRRGEWGETERLAAELGREKHVFTERGHFLWRCLSLIANDRPTDGRGRGRTPPTHE